MLELNKLNIIYKTLKTMKSLKEFIQKKVNGVITTLVINGIILLILGVLIAWYNFMVRLTVGLMTIVLAYTCLYLAYKIWKFKHEVMKYIK